MIMMMMLQPLQQFVDESSLFLSSVLQLFCRSHYYKWRKRNGKTLFTFIFHLFTRSFLFFFLHDERMILYRTKVPHPSQCLLLSAFLTASSFILQIRPLGTRRLITGGFFLSLLLYTLVLKERVGNNNNKRASICGRFLGLTQLRSLSTHSLL